MKSKSKSMRKKSIAVLAGLAIAGAVGASAASLGGLNSDNLGADTGVVASCDIDGVDVDYSTTFDSSSGEYVVDTITLSDVNLACDGQTWELTALDGATPSAILYTDSDTLALGGGTTQAIVLAAGDEFSAEALESLALSISTTP